MWSGLQRNQRAAQHLAGKLSGFFHRTRQTHAAFFAGLGLDKMALAAATGVDLRFDNPQRAIQLARGGFGIFSAGDKAPV